MGIQHSWPVTVLVCKPVPPTIEAFVQVFYLSDRRHCSWLYTDKRRAQARGTHIWQSPSKALLLGELRAWLYSCAGATACAKGRLEDELANGLENLDLKSLTWRERL